METKMHISGKGIAKVVGATCLATGVVALGAVVASGAAAGAVVESFKSAKNIVKGVLKKEETSDAVAEEDESILVDNVQDVEEETEESVHEEIEKTEETIKNSAELTK